ncbi:MAG: diacylglycerol kinase family lipid kinase [Actinomycetota bacterium]|nr:diacylglycerol kinase family lipid kinase [Actinomycetota bacterium]
MRAMLIVNPHATSTTERRRDLLTHALAGEVDLRVEHTLGRGHAAELAAKAAEDGIDLVVVHGGDGTVNEVANGLLAAGLRPDIPALSIVPGGSTNVFARAIGVEPDPTAATEQILDALAAHRPPRTVSLGRAGRRYFTFNAGMGIDADVVRRVEERRAAGGKISNRLHLSQALRAYRASDRKSGSMVITLPGDDPIPDCQVAFVSNVDPWTYLGRRPIRTNPDTSTESGLGVFLSRSLKFPTVAHVVGQLARSKPGRGPHGRKLVRADDVAWVRVAAPNGAVGVQADGDYLGEFDEVEFVSVPNALKVIR